MKQRVSKRGLQVTQGSFVGPGISVVSLRQSADRPVLQSSNFKFNVGFTLIELLVVILIIAVLAGLLLPAVLGGFKRAEVAQAKSEVKLIEMAVMAYLAEYEKFPGQYSSAKAYEYQGGSGNRDYQMLIATLRGSNVTGSVNDFLSSSSWKNQNPRGRIFLTISEKSIVTNNIGNGQWSAQQGELADPWGNRYLVAADWNMGGKIPPSQVPDLGSNIKVTNSVAVWSWGPNAACWGDKSKWPVKSQIYSWQ